MPPPGWNQPGGFWLSERLGKGLGSFCSLDVAESAVRYAWINACCSFGISLGYNWGQEPIRKSFMDPPL